MANLANKLRYFRSSRGISQMDIEISTDLSFGSVSRFESGKVNPTKETIYKISEILNLSNSELDYLIGSTANPATDNEIKEAIKEIEYYFQKPLVLALLIDDRFRLIAMSKSYKQIIGINDSEFNSSLMLKTLPELLISESNPFNKFLGAEFLNNLEQILIRVKNRMGFMIDDKYYNRIINTIRSNEKVNNLWHEILIQDVTFHSIPINKRQIIFGTKDNPIKMHYSNETLEKNPRFSVIEFYPNMQFYRRYKNIISLA